MIQFDASYSAEDDKIRIRATERLDAETYARVKAAGFGWAPKQEVFYAIWSPGREDLAIELSGGELEDEETTLAERAEARAERFAGYKENRTRDAESAQRAVHAIADNIPLGQPILVGHHSERHARRDAEKIENGMRRTCKLWETAAYWQRRAASAIANAQYKEIPAVRARRIKKLEAERRSIQRDTEKSQAALDMWAQDPITLERAKLICNHNHYSACFKLAEYPRQPPASQYEGQQSFWSALEDGTITAEQAKALAVDASTRAIAHRARWLSHLGNRIAYERAMLGESGGLKADKFQIEVGGQVQRRGDWRIVTKVNRTDGAIRSVTVLGHFARTIAIEDVADYRAPAEGVVEKVKAATKLPPMCNYPGEGFRNLTTAEWDQHKRITDVRHSVVHKATENHGAHRTRATHGPNWSTVSVYVTDAKRVDPPAPTAATPAPQIEVLPPVPTVRREPKAPDPIQENLKAARAAAKAGVQVVSAPQLFPTPPALAARMVELAGIEAGDRVLEPSAGTGNILKAIAEAEEMWRAFNADVEVTAIEIDYRLAEAIPAHLADEVITGDFLLLGPSSRAQFERVVMNPPFSKGTDCAHVKHALEFLKPGGRLVAICANGPRQQAELKPLATTWEELPEGTFADQHTNVRTVMLTIQR
jgi:protein-L-isoaspartate O-methyltransferase